MITSFSILVVEFILLSFVSNTLTKTFFRLLYRIARSEVVATSIISLILFPGTVVHELSHLFTAEILGVRTGNLSLVPKNIPGGQIETGSVAIGSTGPFRRTLIGIAPLLVGTGVITVLSYFFVERFQPMILVGSWDAFMDWNVILELVFYYYAIGSISNSMFSSKPDMRGSIPVFLTLTIIIGGAIASGLHIYPPEIVVAIIYNLLRVLTMTMGGVLGINIVTLLVLSILLRVFRYSSDYK